MLSFFVHLIATAGFLVLAANLLRGFYIEGWGSALIGALMIGIVNAVIRPVMVFLTFPFTVITFGLFLLVINALMPWLAAALTPGIRIRGFWTALMGSLLLTVFNGVVELVL